MNAATGASQGRGMSGSLARCRIQSTVPTKPNPGKALMLHNVKSGGHPPPPMTAGGGGRKFRASSVRMKGFERRAE